LPGGRWPRTSARGASTSSKSCPATTTASSTSGSSARATGRDTTPSSSEDTTAHDQTDRPPRSSIVIRSPVLPRFAVEPPDHAPEGTHRIGSVPLTGGGTAWVVHAHRRGRIPSATWRRDRTWSAAGHGARIRRRGTEMRAVDLWAVPKLVVDGDPFEPWGVHVEAPLDGARPVR
jgi:hypothetical protein